MKTITVDEYGSDEYRTIMIDKITDIKEIDNTCLIYLVGGRSIHVNNHRSTIVKIIERV